MTSFIFARPVIVTFVTILCFLFSALIFARLEMGFVKHGSLRGHYTPREEYEIYARSDKKHAIVRQTSSIWTYGDDYYYEKVEEEEEDDDTTCDVLFDDASKSTAAQNWISCRQEPRIRAHRNRLLTTLRSQNGHQPGYNSSDVKDGSLALSNNSSESDIVVINFKHIHKAAGVYFCNSYAKKNVHHVPRGKNCIPQNETYCYELDDKLREDQFGNILDLTSSEGPLPDIIPLDLDTKTIWLTILRHPIDRTLSSYHYFLKLQDTERKKRFMDNDGMQFGECNNYRAPYNASLLSFLEHYPDNYVTRDLCGRHTMNNVPKWGINEFHYECAVRRLQFIFSVVLVAEMEYEWPVTLEKTLGWKRFPISSPLSSSPSLSSDFYTNDSEEEVTGKETWRKKKKEKNNRHERPDGATVASTELLGYENSSAILQMMNDMHIFDMKLYEFAKAKMANTLLF